MRGVSYREQDDRSYKGGINMTVKIEFKTNNAAFEDPGEVSRILREIAGNIDAGSARDGNGQPVGKYSVKR